jgi:antitoxin component YwqK of YwqJK toxin-antitoxin module
MTKPKASKKVSERYDNGELMYTGQHKNGKMHGPWVFYRRDGSRMRTGSFDMGERAGVWRTYARDGRLVKETVFGERKKPKK